MMSLSTFKGVMINKMKNLGIKRSMKKVRCMMKREKWKTTMRKVFKIAFFSYLKGYERESEEQQVEER